MFGQVFLGKDQDGLLVAAKEIFVGNPDWRCRVEAEVEAHRKLPDHPNLVRFIHSQRKGPYIWIFYQYYPAGDLNSYCSKHSLTEAQKVDIMVQMTRGLQHLHSQKKPIAHRDIKPSNLLVNDEDGKVTIKLCDLGLAKRIDTQSKMLYTNCGTFDFMAPEQHNLDRNNEVKYTIKVDIFSSGIFFHSLLDTPPKSRIKTFKVRGSAAGQLMYYSDMKEALTTPPVEFCHTDSAATKLLKALISQMISMDPSKRPAVQQVLDELTKIAKLLIPRPWPRGTEENIYDCPSEQTQNKNGPGDISPPPRGLSKFFVNVKKALKPKQGVQSQSSSDQEAINDESDDIYEEPMIVIGKPVSPPQPLSASCFEYDHHENALPHNAIYSNDDTPDSYQNLQPSARSSQLHGSIHHTYLTMAQSPQTEPGVRSDDDKHYESIYSPGTNTAGHHNPPVYENVSPQPTPPPPGASVSPQAPTSPLGFPLSPQRSPSVMHLNPPLDCLCTLCLKEESWYAKITPK